MPGVSGINLAEAEVLVLRCHGHDDHTDNLPDFYALNPNAPMYCGASMPIAFVVVQENRR